MPKLFFIAGIHGVGKTTICNELSNVYNLFNTSASAIIKANKGEVLVSKNVSNVELNQLALIDGLRKMRVTEKNILLDGHFTLLNSSNEIVLIENSVFDDINPDVIIVLTNDINVIRERLFCRDDKEYSLDLLENMQINEIKAASENAAKLKVPYLELNLYADKDSFNTLSNFVLTNI